MLQVWLPLNGNLNSQGLNNTNGTWVGTSNYDNNGKIGKCISCNSSHYVICPYNFLSTNKFSQTFWIYIPSTLGNCGLTLTVLRINDYPIVWASYNRLKIYNNGNNLLWWLSSNIFYDKWIHLAIVHTGNTILLYINGLLYGEDTSSSTAISSGTIYLGSGIDTTYGPVKFCDYRLYDSVLSSKQVHEIAKGLVLHYPMNDLYVTTTVYDCSGYCNNGTITGNLLVVNDSPRYKNSIKNTSTVDNIIKAEVNMPSMDQLTLNWWGKYNDGFRNGVSKGHTSLGGYINSSNDYNYASDYDTTAFNYRDGGWDMYNGSSHYRLRDSLGGITDNTWKMYTLVWNGSKAILYVNGNPTNSITVSGALVPWKFLYIGRSMAGGGNRVTAGCWSDIRIYSTALSEDDIKELYNTSAIINNNNTLETYEFSESDTYSINKSGVLEGAEFIEQNGEVLINNTEQVFATEFTEI